jgi:hypothetical protein
MTAETNVITKVIRMILKHLFFALALPALLISCNNGGGSGRINYPRNPFGAGPMPISLSPNGGAALAEDRSAAGNYVIMAKSGITNTSASVIVGDIAASPVDQTYITQFAETRSTDKQYSTSAQVTGKIFASDYATPTPNNLSVAILNMETAYTDGAGRSNPDATELYAGDLSGQTIYPGLYKWTNTVMINTDMYISGSPTDVFIFQIAGNVSMEAAKQIHMLGGARPENVYWVVAGEVTIKTDAHFEGIILSKTAVTLQTRSSLNGRVYAQTLVTLDQSTVKQP